MNDPGNFLKANEAEKSILNDIRLTYYLLDNGIASIYVINTITQNFVDVNSTACFMLGYTREELLSMKLKDIQTDIPENPNWIRHLEQIKKSSKKLEQLTYEMHRKKDSTFYLVEISAINIAFDDEPYMVITSRDINDRLNYEEKIFQQQQALALSAKMAALGEMSEGIAHEINSPLAIIKLSADQIMRGLDNEEFTKETVRDKLGKINNTVDRIAKIISGLLRYSGETGEEAFITYNLLRIIDDCENLCRQKIISKGINFKITRPLNTVEINCRPSQIAQAVMNLIDNALEAALRIESDDRWITLDITEDHNYAIISVADCGPGIPSEIISKIFDPFFTLKPIGQGPGLGLSVAKGIVESHEGTLELNNQMNPTTFVIRLPKFESV
jgi:PAS domain S-box-containing protein